MSDTSFSPFRARARAHTHAHTHIRTRTHALTLHTFVAVRAPAFGDAKPLRVRASYLGEEGGYVESEADANFVVSSTPATSAVETKTETEEAEPVSARGGGEAQGETSFPAAAAAAAASAPAPGLSENTSRIIDQVFGRKWHVPTSSGTGNATATANNEPGINGATVPAWTNSNFTPTPEQQRRRRPQVASGHTVDSELGEGSSWRKFYRTAREGGVAVDGEDGGAVAEGGKLRSVKLNRKRLESLLNTYGQFPDKYRLLVWRFLLRLPENSSAFAALVHKGPHPAFKSFRQSFPIRNKRLLNKLERTLSALAHWSPVFADVPYLPNLAFPFVKLFGGDSLAAFETVMSVVLNWCGGKGGAAAAEAVASGDADAIAASSNAQDGWFDTVPFPPVGVLMLVERLLRHHDPTLHQHLSFIGASSQVYAWSTLRTLFSEVLR